MRETPRVPDNPLEFIRNCVHDRSVFWTYHVNIRLERRSIPRLEILDAAESFEIIESYPDDKYLPSFLVLARITGRVCHVLFAVDTEGENVRVVTAYWPSHDDWEEDLRTRRRT